MLVTLFPIRFATEFGALSEIIDRVRINSVFAGRTLGQNDFVFA